MGSNHFEDPLFGCFGQQYSTVTCSIWQYLTCIPGLVTLVNCVYVLLKISLLLPFALLALAVFVVFAALCAACLPITFPIYYFCDNNAVLVSPAVFLSFLMYIVYVLVVLAFVMAVGVVLIPLACIKDFVKYCMCCCCLSPAYDEPDTFCEAFPRSSLLPLSWMAYMLLLFWLVEDDD
jgi:hypothetical protein